VLFAITILFNPKGVIAVMRDLLTEVHDTNYLTNCRRLGNIRQIEFTTLGNKSQTSPLLFKRRQFGNFRREGNKEKLWACNRSQP
jgi:hypothetical protein